MNREEQRFLAGRVSGKDELAPFEVERGDREVADYPVEGCNAPPRPRSKQHKAVGHSNRIEAERRGQLLAIIEPNVGDQQQAFVSDGSIAEGVFRKRGEEANAERHAVARLDGGGGATVKCLTGEGGRAKFLGPCLRKRADDAGKRRQWKRLVGDG